MRSITCLSSVAAVLSDSPAAGAASAAAFNVESSNSVFSVLELPSPNGGVQIDFQLVQGFKRDQITTLATYFSSSIPTFEPKFTHGPRNVLDFRMLSESQVLCLVLAGGDLVTWSIDGQNEPEIVGIFDAGIKAARWSPDEELLVLITGDDKLVQMTKDFDVLSDAPLRSDEFGEDQAINVGWGSKKTQFHGSAGKAAAQAPTQSASAASVSPSDDTLPHISWRDDGAHFSVSTLDPPSSSSPSSRRALRNYDRLAVLQATSELVPGLEHPVAWSGAKGLIASTQRYPEEEGRKGRHDVVFFERNGLRHGEFGLTEKLGSNYRVRDLEWNADSSILAVWVEREGHDVVQLWTMGNYHWYKKQEVSALATSASVRFTSLAWHPEDPLKLALTTPTSLEIRSFSWDVYASTSRGAEGTGLVAVVDDASLLLTPFRVQNVPPPMSTAKIVSSGLPPPVHVAFAPNSEVVAELFSSGEIRVRDVKTKLQRGPGKTCSFDAAPRTMQLPSTLSGRQVALQVDGQRNRVAVLGWDAELGADRVWLSESTSGEKEGHFVDLAGSGAGKLFALGDGFAFQSARGVISKLNSTSTTPEPLASSFPAFCSTVKSTSHQSTSIAVGLSALGSLHALSESSQESYQIATDATSVVLSSDFLIYTTTAHQAVFVPLAVLLKILDGGWIVSEAEKEWEKRRVERGSSIVTVVDATMALVLQMPRGNLETIYPRPLVLAEVRRDIEGLRYKEAFVSCRKHRIDLNILYDHDPALWLSNVAPFVEQIEAVDSMNLFIGGLKNEDVSKSMYRLPGTGASTSSAAVYGKINKICDTIRVELDRVDMIKYVDSILTSLVVKTPPDHEGALRILHKLKTQHAQIVEDAIKYVIFLTDVDHLFNVALGMYDFQLVLMIAQYSQKDPREYLPFLRELRALDRYYQRFKIDDHLERRSSALKNLQLAGVERFDEAIAYVEKYDLHKEAVAIWAEQPEQLKTIFEVYGEHLYDGRHFMDAALAFSLAGNRPRELKSYEKAHAWKELFTLAMTQKLPKEEVLELCERIAGHLSSRARHVEAGRLILDYGDDLPQAVSEFCKGRDYTEAYRLTALHDEPRLIEEVIHPSLLETKNMLSEDIVEIDEQMTKQVARLDELRAVKLEQPDHFYMQDDPALENIDVATDATGAPSAFTRYTVQATTVLTKMTGQTKLSARSKRKNLRKKAGGRRGTVDEEVYLLNSLARLVTKFKALITECEPILNQLLVATVEHRAAGVELQRALLEMESKLRTGVQAAWAVEGESEEDALASVRASLEAEADKAEVRPVRPTVGEWEGGNGFLGSSI